MFDEMEQSSLIGLIAVIFIITLVILHEIIKSATRSTFIAKQLEEQNRLLRKIAGEVDPSEEIHKQD